MTAKEISYKACTLWCEYENGNPKSKGSDAILSEMDILEYAKNNNQPSVLGKMLNCIEANVHGNGLTKNRQYKCMNDYNDGTIAIIDDHGKEEVYSLLFFKIW